MTDSIIQFNYSDNIHLTTIYIRSDTHEETFIPELKKIIDEFDYEERGKEGRLNWGYVVLAIINKISKWVGRYDGIKILGETPRGKCNVIYMHIVKPNENYGNRKMPLADALHFNSLRPISDKHIFTGTLSSYVAKLENEKTTN